jgi:hypothetical protein
MNKTVKEAFDKFLEVWTYHHTMENPDFEYEVMFELSKDFEFFRTKDTDFKTFKLMPNDIVLNIDEDPSDLSYWSPDGIRLEPIFDKNSIIETDDIEIEEEDEDIEMLSAALTWKEYLAENDWFRKVGVFILVVRKKIEYPRVKSFKDFRN